MFHHTIQFVYPLNTHAISLSGSACALNCDHCNKHYIKQMSPLSKPIPAHTQSVLLSGGLDKKGRSFILKKAYELKALKENGKYRFNSHVGFVEEKEVNALIGIVDFISFDFVSDSAVIKRVYHLDKSLEDCITQFKLLSSKIPTYPHITIGLDASKIHWEYTAIDILHNLHADRLVLNVLVPTEGTKFAHLNPPKLEDVQKVIRYARYVFKDKLLIIGCMRPKGKYRLLLDVIALNEGVDRIVQPTLEARKRAKDLGLNIQYLYECCVLNPLVKKDNSVAALPVV